MLSEHRTSNDGIAALSQSIKRQDALFDVGRWTFRSFLHAIALPEPISAASISQLIFSSRSV
jgi:hypothetical protein